MDSLVSVDDLALWSDKPVSNRGRAEAIIVAASTLVRSFKGGAWVEVDEPAVSPVELEAARTVIKQVAYRTFFNPQGATSNTAGPFSTTIDEWAALGCVLTDAEKGQLAGTSRLGGLGSIRTTRGRVETASPRRYA